MQRMLTPRQSGPAGNRLVQLLGQLDGVHARVNHGDFAERLGRLFDLSDAIALDGATRHEPAGPFTPTDGLLQRLQDDLLNTRRTLLDQLARSFRGHDGASVIPLPPLDPDSRVEKRPAFSAYERFYLAHQRQIIAAIANLRLRCRRQLASGNATLAHLAEMDAVFENGLAGYARQGFAALPGFLGRRYRALWQQRDPFHSPADWLAPRGWLQQFRAEARMLLLAELDGRQEPVLGLLAAARQELASPASPDSVEGIASAPALQENNEVSTTP